MVMSRFLRSSNMGNAAQSVSSMVFVCSAKSTDDVADLAAVTNNVPEWQAFRISRESQKKLPPRPGPQEGAGLS